MYSSAEIVTELRRRAAALGINHGERWDELLAVADDIDAGRLLVSDCQHEMLNATSRECLRCGEVLADEM